MMSQQQIEHGEYMRWLDDEDAQREYREWLDRTYCPLDKTFSQTKKAMPEPVNSADFKEKENECVDCK